MLCLVQARVNSKRLPRKMIKKINGNSILEILIDRLKLSKKISEIIILTSKHNSDNPIVKICKLKKIRFYRGPLKNVAKRFYDIIKNKNAKSFIRICGDSPLIDHNLIDKAISKFNLKKYDLLTNIFPRSYPKGQSIEIVNSNTYKNYFLLFNNKNHKEHVTTYFYENFKKFRVILGPLAIVDPKNPGAPQHFSLGDLPISVKYFIQWLNEKLTKTEQVEYNLSKFLNDFFNHLIRNFLNDDSCFTFNTKQKTRLNQAVVTSYKEGNQDEVTAQILKSGAKPYPARLYISQLKEEEGALPLLNISGPANFPVPETGLQNEINYLIFSAGRMQPLGKMMGNRIEDEKDGLFHYIIGRKRGLIKKISLSKTEAPFLKEVRFEQEGYQGLQQLREVYDVNIECFSNPKTFPGTYIFVDPAGFDPTTAWAPPLDAKEETPEGAAPPETAEGGENGTSPANKVNLTAYGIGGYCMIIRSEHSFGPGEANSTLTAKWVAEVSAKEESETQPDTPPESGDNQNTACNELATRQKAASDAAATAEKENAAQADPELTDTVAEPPPDTDTSVPVPPPPLQVETITNTQHFAGEVTGRQGSGTGTVTRLEGESDADYATRSAGIIAGLDRQDAALHRVRGARARMQSEMRK